MIVSNGHISVVYLSSHECVARMLASQVSYYKRYPKNANIWQMLFCRRRVHLLEHSAKCRMQAASIKVKCLDACSFFFPPGMSPVHKDMPGCKADVHCDSSVPVVGFVATSALMHTETLCGRILVRQLCQPFDIEVRVDQLMPE